MQRKVLFVSMVLTLILSACGTPQATATMEAPTSAAETTEPTAETPAATEANSQPTSQVPVTGGAAVALSSSNDLGQFLVDDQGMTLYLFTKDEPGLSNCYDNCATNWPPLLTDGAPVAGEGLDASLLGTTQRTDGTTQVTYNGWPLYYYIKDAAPGDTTGQDVGGVWFVVAPDGTAGPSAESPAAPATTPPAAPSYGTPY